MGRRTGRTDRVEFSFEPDVANGIRSTGGAKQTGNGRFNWSEIFNSIAKFILNSHDEQLLLQKAKVLERKFLELEELKLGFLKLSGGLTHIEFLADFYIRKSEASHNAVNMNDQMNVELHALFNDIQRDLPKWKMTIQEWVGIKSNWEKVLFVGFTQGKSDFIGQYADWQRRLSVQVVSK